MMFAAPLFAWIAGGVALAVVGLHLLAWRRPPETPLPTVRFAPERPVRMVSRAIRPSDLLLLVLRVVTVLLIGVAIAGPSFNRRTAGTARVVVVDRSRAARGTVAVVDSARRIFRPGDAVVLFDSSAHEVEAPAADSIAAAPSAAPGSMSAALVAAIRAARRLERTRDTVEIVLVSPIDRSELDAATGAIRRSWNGALRVVRIEKPPVTAPAPGVPTIRAVAGDALAAAVRLIGPFSAGNDVRLVRDGPTANDSAWARAGRTLVVWPEWPDSAGWRARAARDTAFAVATIPASDLGVRGATLVAASPRVAEPPAGRVVARWADGVPAATEMTLGDGCVRHVAIATPATGDLALTPAFGRFAARLLAACDGHAAAMSASDSLVAALLPRALVPAERATGGELRAGATVTRLAPWLLGAALVLLLAELALRRGGDHATP